MKYKELEFKYNADGKSMQEFMDLVEPMKPAKIMMVSSYDDYFVNKKENFVRYRYTDERGELTIKYKTTDKNNNERIEINLPTSGDNFDHVSEFCKYLGYDWNFSIYKTCKIYWVDNVVLVYYVVYDKEMKELRRFIEIEADEEHDWESEQQAWDKVVEYEKILAPLGITPQNRLKKSLFEIFYKPKAEKK